MRQELRYLPFFAIPEAANNQMKASKSNCKPAQIWTAVPLRQDVVRQELTMTYDCHSHLVSLGGDKSLYMSCVISAESRVFTIGYRYTVVTHVVSIFQQKIQFIDFSLIVRGDSATRLNLMSFPTAIRNHLVQPAYITLHYI